MVKTYYKKPVKVEAVRWDGTNFKEIRKFAGDSCFPYKDCAGADVLVIRTLEGNHIAKVGDYIIKGVRGEFYPCKPDIFEETYEEASV